MWTVNFNDQSEQSNANLLAFRVNLTRKVWDFRKSQSPKPGYWIWWTVAPGAPRNALMHAYLPTLLQAAASFPSHTCGRDRSALPSRYGRDFCPLGRTQRPGEDAFTPHVEAAWSFSLFWTPRKSQFSGWSLLHRPCRTKRLGREREEWRRRVSRHAGMSVFKVAGLYCVGVTTVKAWWSVSLTLLRWENVPRKRAWLFIPVWETAAAAW